MQALQHLSLAMPEEGIEPLASLTSLTFLRLKWREPDPPPAAPTDGVLFCATGMSSVLMAHYVRSSFAAGKSSTFPDAAATAVGAAVWAHTTTAVAFFGAVAAPLGFALGAAARRRLHRCGAPRRPPPLAALAALTRLEWLDLKGSSAVPAGAWRGVLTPLRRLRRLDVRGTSFHDGGALRGKRKLRVLLVTPSGGMSEATLRRQGQLGHDVRIRI
jgi:hypothetical protein